MSNSRFLTERDNIYSTEAARALVDIGGLKTGKDITNMSVKELLKQIIQPYKAPTINSFKLTGTTTNLEKDGSSVHKITSANFELEYWSNIITSYTTTCELNSTGSSEIADLSKSSNIKFDENDKYKIKVSYNTPINGPNQSISDADDTITYTLTVSDGKTDTSSLIYRYYIRPYYYGSELSTTELNLNSLNSDNRVVSKVSNGMSLSFSGNGEPRYSFIAYPTSYKKLKSVVDSNGFTQTWELITNGEEEYFTITKDNNLKLNYYIYKSDVSKFDTASYKFTFGG